MTLVQYIDKVGAVNVARKLSINIVTICNWTGYRSLPNAHRQVELVKFSRGKITYKEMVEDYVKYKAKKPKSKSKK